MLPAALLGPALAAVVSTLVPPHSHKPAPYRNNFRCDAPHDMRVCLAAAKSITWQLAVIVMFALAFVQSGFHMMGKPTITFLKL